MAMIGPDDLEAFGYWTPDEITLMEQPKTVQEMVTEFNQTCNHPKNPSLYETLISEEYDEWFDAGEVEPGNTFIDTPYDPAAELKELADLAYVIYGYAWAKGWDLDEALRRVHENNMGRMYQPDGTIKRREDGKIMKNPDYPKVDLKDLV